ncbi:MAG: glycosyltransferase family 2 protein [Cellulosilyticum sp.]|nr:glycosyltransferase family 2 protein [Cellulosilyticum sp.]
MKKLISLVIPMYFEEEVVDECYSRLSKVMQGMANYEYELIFVNDGSTDRTLEILEQIAGMDKCVKVLSLARNFGHQVAVSCGIDYAKGDALVIIDADLQDPPEVIPDMVKLWEQGYEVVYGKRKRRQGETKFKLVTAKLFYKVLDHLSEVHIPRDTGDFRLIDRKVANVLRGLSEHNRFLRGLVAWSGFNQIPLEYVRDERFAGETKYPFKKMVKFALDGIISFSAKPLRLITGLGFISVGIAIFIMFYAIGSFIFPNIGTVPGWTSIMVTVAFIGGVQLIAIGILGEYIARMYDESKNRPLYIVSKQFNVEDK